MHRLLYRGRSQFNRGPREMHKIICPDCVKRQKYHSKQKNFVPFTVVNVSRSIEHQDINGFNKQFWMNYLHFLHFFSFS
jgi:hypothetical protein